MAYRNWNVTGKLTQTGTGRSRFIATENLYTSATRPTLAEIAAFCRETGLATQKIPEQLEWVDEFPRNASGKLLKFELRERFA